MIAMPLDRQLTLSGYENGKGLRIGAAFQRSHLLVIEGLLIFDR
jgi:hypothetical protein